MRISRSPQKNIKFDVIVLLLAALIYVFSSIGLFTGVQAVGFGIGQHLTSAGRDVIDTADGWFGLLGELQQIRVENIELTQQVVSANTELANLRQVEEENKWLREQIGLLPKQKNKRFLAQVLRYQYVPAGYMYIDVAGYDGALGSLAISGREIVGEVVEVVADYAKVRLISSPDTDLAVKIGDKEIVGRLVGSGSLRPEVVDVTNMSQVRVGDEVKLLNPESLVADRYIFGKIQKKLGSEVEPARSAELKTAVDLQELDYVILLTNE